MLEGVIQLARAAGEEVLAVYACDSKARTKDDGSPVTEADERAQEVICAGLAKLCPGVPITAEESCDPERTAPPDGSFWLVDPLDGTKEFLSRNGEFTVNIALIEGHAPSLGVVHVPVTDTSYRGLPGTGAWRQRGGGEPEPIHVSERTGAPLRVAGSRS